MRVALGLAKLRILRRNIFLRAWCNLLFLLVVKVKYSIHFWLSQISIYISVVNLTVLCQSDFLNWFLKGAFDVVFFKKIFIAQ